MKTVTLATCLMLCAAAAHAEDRWMTIPAPPAMPAATAEGKAEVNGISMYYAVYGTAETTPILMIHGGLGHADLWAAEVADLAADHKVIVAVTRGHGRSTNDGSAYSYDLLATDYVALLDHLGVEKVDLVGWSDGANIGFTMALTAPDRLEHLFAHAGNVTLDGIDPTVSENAVFGSYVGMMAKDYARLSPTPDGFDAFLGAIVKMWESEKPNGMAALASIRTPTLIVQSEHDEAIRMAHAEAIAAAIPGAKLVTLDDVSHFALLQDPKGYVAAIRSFLKD